MGALFGALLGACAGGHDPSQPPDFSAGTAVPVDLAVHYLDRAVDQRITVSGLPRARAGRCPGVQPLTRKDWMLTGDHDACLWVSGQVDEARLLDLRPGTRKQPIIVTGRLLRTAQGTYVLKIEP